jgi:hypothetical protein
LWDVGVIPGWSVSEEASTYTSYVITGLVPVIPMV